MRCFALATLSWSQLASGTGARFAAADHRRNRRHLGVIRSSRPRGWQPRAIEFAPVALRDDLRLAGCPGRHAAAKP